MTEKNQETAEQPDDGRTRAEGHGLDSAEIQATTFVIDGIPMSFDEMAQYREQKDAAAEAERQAALERCRQQLEEDAADRAAARAASDGEAGENE